MGRIVTCVLIFATFKVALSGVTAGNDGTRGGNYKFGSAPDRISRGGTSPAEDGHPVHGITCQSTALQGKIFQAGKCVGNAESSPVNHACGVLFNADGTVAWSWVPTPGFNQASGSVNANTDEYMTAVAEAPDGSYLLAFGHVNKHRTIYKINPADGSTIFEYRWTDFSNSAFEFGFFGTDGNVYAVGFKNAEAGGTWYFKSSGVVDAGQAFWQKITAAEIAANSLPATSDVQVFGDFMAFRHFAKAAQGFVAVGPTDGEVSGIMKLNEDGTKDWSTPCSACGHQFTGVSTGQGGTTFYVSGHGNGDGSETERSSSAAVSFGIDGKVSHFNSQGVHQWTKRYPTPAASVTKIPASDMRVVFEECWSIDATSDGGAVVGCGSGTHCGEAPNDWQSQCNAADMETWQSMIFKISADGTLVWLRIDAEPVNAATGPENAAEYATVNPDGTILITHDDTNGMGFATFGAGDEVVVPEGGASDDDASDDGGDDAGDGDSDDDDAGSGHTDGAPTQSLILTFVAAVSAVLVH